MAGIRNSVATATLKDVAREAEVSVATVSRVINGSENVSKTTRSRVLSAIETLQILPMRMPYSCVECGIDPIHKEWAMQGMSRRAALMM